MAGVPVAHRSRVERRAEMCERILDATVQCLVEVGYKNTSTLAVQERAGVSRGALLHYFPTRDELVVAAVDRLFDSVTADLRARVAPEGTDADRVADAINLLWSSFRGPLFGAASGLWTGARTDPKLLAVLIPHERRLGREIKALCRDLFGPELS